MADAELGYEAMDRLEDRIERIAIARKDHPGGECASSFAPEGVEALVDDYSSIGFSSSGSFDRVGNVLRDRIGDGPRKLALEARRRPEMMEKIGVSPSNVGGDGL